MTIPGFIIRKYAVGVDGYGDAYFYAKNKNQARMRAFNAMQSANGAITFKRFLQIVGHIEEASTPSDFGKPILVNGKSAFWVEHAGGNSVQFVWPDDATIYLSHESDIEVPS